MQSNDTAPPRTVERACEVCSTTMLVKSSDIAKGHGRFCSRTCFSSTRMIRAQRICESCCAAFTVKASLMKRFCSNACSSLARQRRETRICEACAESFVYRPSPSRGAGRGRFCSVSCHDDAQRTERPVDVRLWDRVDKSGPVPPHRAEYGPCWLWTGKINPSGYGRIYRHFPDAVLIHRLAWEVATGDTLTPDDVIGHICDVRHCLRNDEDGTYIVNGIALPRRGHLFKGTDADNVADMYEKGRQRFVLDQYIKRGEDSEHALLTEDNVREIRALYAAGGISQQALSDRFGVNQSNISHVILRRNWKHVE